MPEDPPPPPKPSDPMLACREDTNGDKVEDVKGDDW